jgi:hypothetical protein
MPAYRPTTRDSSRWSRASTSLLTKDAPVVKRAPSALHAGADPQLTEIRRVHLAEGLGKQTIAMTRHCS